MMGGMKPEVRRVESIHGTFPPRWEIDLEVGVFWLSWTGAALDYKDAIRQAGEEWEHVFSCSDADAPPVPLEDEAS